jgi:transglutaminase/protease-like cytokinesis protein 3
VDAEYIKPSRLVDSANPRIVELVHKIVADKADAWQKAVAISEWVHANLTRDLSKIGLEPASRVAQRLSGDTHAQTILMSALCRAAGIPSRSALGLVYSSQYDGFMFHAWNEVSIDGRWVALDPVFNQSEVDATHIKLDDTSLAGPDPFRAFVTLQRVMSKMTIEPEKIDTAEDPPKRVPEGAEAAPVK